MTDATVSTRGSIFSSWKFWLGVGSVGIFAMWVVSHMNGFVVLDQKVQTQTAQVQNVLRRQYELLPNLAETVKGYAQFEKETFEGVASARSRAGGVINVDAAKIAADPALQKQMQEAANTMGNTIGRLLMLQEKYPELKAEKGFQDLRTELAGSQNRITQERRVLQQDIQRYNVAVLQFPGNVAALTLGYKQKPYFEAGSEAQNAPKLDMKLNSSSK